MVMEVVHKAVPDISVNLGLALLVFFEMCIPFANHKSLDGAKAAKVLRIFCGMRRRVTQDSVWRKRVERGDRALRFKSEGAGIS